MLFSTFSLSTLADAPTTGAPKLQRSSKGALVLPKSGLDPRSLNSEIHITHLAYNSEQREQVSMLYALYRTSPGQTPLTDHIFDGKSLDDQIRAADILETTGLDANAYQSLSNRWSLRWSRATGSTIKTCRILYQCTLGYDHTQRSTKAANEVKRTIPTKYTGCLAHVKLTVRTFVTGDHILRIRGHLQHNQECSNSPFERKPCIPLHPDVFEVALKQLNDGSTIADIRRKNLEMCKAAAYQHFPTNLQSSPFRWVFQASDSCSLYCKHHRTKGVAVIEAPKMNINNWLDPDSENYDGQLAKSIFHYSARSALGDRFEVCIATQEMNEAAWQYGHKKQIILDGTFGICDKQLLLFIVMVVDHDKKGVPVAFMMFSAPAGNKQSSLGYDSEILTKLLHTWRDSLNAKKPPGASLFTPVSAITDTDLKERAALAAVFSGIFLLICRFHLRQSWRNHRNRVLKGKRTEWMDLKKRMMTLEAALPKTEQLVDARGLILHERRLLEAALEESPESSHAISKAITHLDYLDNYWLSENLWESWSNHNRRAVANILLCKIEGVIPTTNHLESFNGVLKQTHLKHWQHSGRRLRVDVLLNVLVLHILPSIFEQRQMYKDQNNHIAALIQLLPGGASLLEDDEPPQSGFCAPKVAYLTPDVQRNVEAQALLDAGQVDAPTALPGNVGLLLACYSSHSLSVEKNPTIYSVRVGFNGVVSCSCLDFSSQGGACKHIRAALLLIAELCSTRGMSIPNIPIPKSANDALILQQREVLMIKIRLPIAWAVKEVERLSGGSRGDVSTEENEEEDENNDNTRSVGTNESSDSEIEHSLDWDSNFDSPRATQNQRALSEQRLAKSLYSLDAVGKSSLEVICHKLASCVTGASAGQLEMIHQNLT
ncbi:unnamed protein product [Mycena citricolor]|uniref:SWIM-type domain-containing protein n=1 Tax=Mycena citricolor TaxID=2018698 RepID=A0AAD2HCW4_9AGAR|nr:unnamed protein product [Mycena citricolor]